MSLISPHTRNILGSTLASTARFWRGTNGSRTVKQPPSLPELYDREGCPQCRLVREALTELNLDAMIYPCPENGERFMAQLEAHSGAREVPFLVDPNTGEAMGGPQAIIDYLFQQYRGRQAPSQLRASALNLASSRLSTLLRGKRGISATPSHSAEQPMTLYSFESSPFSRPVREKLCELEIPYRLINLSKQQLADLGPATQRMHLGPYRPLPGSKRELFMQEHGNVQVPYLVDPNRQTSLFESAKILRYLDEHYVLSQ